jgi:phosphoribosylanthranilate isomerase
MKRFQVKVCGVTRVEDALLAAKLGADMIGMIFYHASPRCLSVSAARSIVRQLPATVDRVGVFVNEDVATILKAAERLNLDYIQLHGDETAGDIVTLKRNGYKVIKAYRLSSKTDYARLYASKADLVLVDNMTDDRRGGTGRPFDWRLIPLRKIPNLVLAGGISADNIEAGVKRFAPLVVDVNSGVETRPGVKSAAKLRRFFQGCDRLRYG